MSRTGCFEKKEPEVLEKLIKLAGEGGGADNFTEGDKFPGERAGGAREAEEIADNFTEGDEFPEERAGGARETDKIAGEGEAIRDKIDEVVH